MIRKSSFRLACIRWRHPDAAALWFVLKEDWVNVSFRNVYRPNYKRCITSHLVAPESNISHSKSYNSRKGSSAESVRYAQTCWRGGAFYNQGSNWILLVSLKHKMFLFNVEHCLFAFLFIAIWAVKVSDISRGWHSLDTKQKLNKY